MKNFTTTYILVFSIILVTAVAALLSFVALQLKPAQEENIKTEKMQNILASVRIESTTKNASDLFDKYITNSYVVDLKGKKVEGVNAFEVDLIKEVFKINKIKELQAQLQEKRVSPFKKFLAGFINFKAVDMNLTQKKINEIENKRYLPVYECSADDGNKYYVFPLRGKGLWGPIWGYVSVQDDFNTVYGAVFDHKGETPGLGAEINKGWFQVNFRGKKIFDNGEFKSITVSKVGTVEPSKYNVDAISGGTITSKGVQAMLFDCLIGYKSFVELNKN